MRNVLQWSITPVKPYWNACILRRPRRLNTPGSFNIALNSRVLQIGGRLVGWDMNFKASSEQHFTAGDCACHQVWNSKGNIFTQIELEFEFLSFKCYCTLCILTETSKLSSTNPEAPLEGTRTPQMFGTVRIRTSSKRKKTNRLLKMYL